MDFTLRKYEELLGCIAELNIPVFSVSDWMTAPKEVGVIMRHDVDRLPGNALKMAQLEARMNVSSTYYFRIGSHTFKPSIIREIHSLGHEIGYHYEDLSSADGDSDRATALFEKHLKEFRAIVPIRTVAMHGQPLSRHNNRDIWKHSSLDSFDLLGEAFLSIDYSETFYFTDTGRSWSHQSANLRDNVRSNRSFRLNNTNDLIDFFRQNPTEKVALVVHPERWNDNLAMWLCYYGFDQLVNFTKKGLSLVRR